MDKRDMMIEQRWHPLPWSVDRRYGPAVVDANGDLVIRDTSDQGTSAGLESYICDRINGYAELVKERDAALADVRFLQEQIVKLFEFLDPRIVALLPAQDLQNMAILRKEFNHGG